MNKLIKTILMFAISLTYSQLSMAANGCGTGWNTKVVRDSYGGANFTNACNNHDACYEKCGETKSSCDKNFRAEMKKECRSTYTSPLHIGQKNACLGVVKGYYVAVKKEGKKAWKKAQSQSNCSNSSSSNIESSYSKSRYAEYSLQISESDSKHWDHHRNNVGQNRWEKDFHRDVVQRLFAQCHDPIGNDLQHWTNHSFNVSPSIFLKDVHNDWRCK